MVRRRDETVLFACTRRRQDRTRYTTRAKVGIRNKKKKEKKERQKESEGREAGEGPRVRSLFRSFINPPP